MRRRLFVTEPLAVDRVRVALRVGDDGEVVLEANEVGELAKRAPGAEEVAEFRRAVNGCRVKNDVVVDVPLVRVGADDVGVTPLQKALGQLTSDAVCLLRRDLAGLERLADVVRDHARLFAAGVLRILPFREHELRRHELRRAAIGVDERAVFSFFRVLDVVHALSERDKQIRSV